MKFLEKNNHIVRLKSESHFYADYKLFNNYFPSHQLNRELEKANQFNRARLDGQMIMLLLDKVSPETIVKFREGYSPNESTGSNIQYDPDAIASIDEAKELFCQNTGWPMNSIDAVTIVKNAVGVNREDFIKTVISDKHYMIFKEDIAKLPDNPTEQQKPVEQTGKKKVSTTNSPK